MSSKLFDDKHSHHSYPRIAILGAGSVGCYLGGKMLEGGYSVVFVARSRILNELKEQGMTITDWHAHRQYIEPSRLKISTDGKVLRNADFIFVTVKSKDTSSLIPIIQEYAKADALVISLQNGIRNAPLLRNANLSQTILAGMLSFNVTHRPNGHFHCGTQGHIVLQNHQKYKSKLHELMHDADLTSQFCDNIQPVMWGKLLLNLNNSINALAGVPLRAQLHQQAYRQVLAFSIEEALTVLAAAKIKPSRTGKVIPSLLPFILRLPNWLFKQVARAMLAIDKQARSSMWDDLEQQRVTEVNYLNGEIVNLANKLSIATPVNQTIIELIHSAESKRSGSPKIAASQLLKLVKIAQLKAT